MAKLPQSHDGAEPIVHPRFRTPRSAYVHVPFCRHHCGYCNFSVIANRLDLADDYLAAIDLETAKLEGPHEVDTLYLGGGTPTQLPAVKLEQLLSLLRSRFPLAEGGELTVEANPEDVSSDHLQVLQAAGVTRVSLGAQSFSQSKLKRLDRQHGVAEIERAIDGVRSINADLALDLIFAAPEEAIADWKSDLWAAVAHEPDHISCYGLTYEEGTRFYGRLHQRELIEVDEDSQRHQYEWAIEALRKGGFEHYEVSNFARPQKRSRHNQAYWLGHTFFGVGPGAARFVNGQRGLNHRSTTAYLKRTLGGEDPTVELDAIDAETYAHDRLVFGLRMLDGIESTDFAVQTGYEIEVLGGANLVHLVELGSLAWTEQRLHLTADGLLVSDAIWPHLL